MGGPHSFQRAKPVEPSTNQLSAGEQHDNLWLPDNAARSLLNPFRLAHRAVVSSSRAVNSMDATAVSNALVAEAISIRISTLKARRLSSSFNSAISDWLISMATSVIRRLQHLRSVVTPITDGGVGRLHRHLVGVKGVKQVQGRPCISFTVVNA